MERLRRIGLSLVTAVLLTLGLVGPALAANPTVTITIAAEIVSIINDQTNWDIGSVPAGSVEKWFATNVDVEEDNYSQITNNGNVAVLIVIQGTDFIDLTDGSHNWTLAASANNKTLSIHANSGNGTSTYNIEVKNSGNSTLIASLAKATTYDWSMKMMTPTGFDPADDGHSKTSTVTLVATKAS